MRLIYLEERKGLFIVLEGIDGTGKTTQAKKLKKRLMKLGYQVAIYKEPTNETEAGKKIRSSYTSGRPSLETELGWFIEDREWNVKTRVMPALEAKQIVLLDRYFYSTACYQGARKNGDWQNILALNRSMFPEPDLIIIFDLDPQKASERITRTRKKTNTFEEIEYLRMVRKLFLEMSNEDTQGNYFIIDASQRIKKISHQLFERILPLIGNKNMKNCLKTTLED
ncbi:MAG: dTMP kinase [Asgard group archaeon]|nr:dTMP kinase [Asgard group archaeon]